MQQFNVLDKNLDLHQNYLLEASAGTGKTFSIENIVVRLLIESHPQRHEPLKIQEILVVTFTRVATRDLIARIHQNIGFAIQQLHSGAIPEEHYLALVIAQGEEVTLAAQRALEEALFCFDQAQIYTIHEFCSKMLRENIFEGNMSMETNFSNRLSIRDIQSAVKNVLRSEVCSDKYCAEQIDILLTSFRGQYKKLEQSLVKWVLQEVDIAEEGSFSHDYIAIQACLNEIKQNNQLDGELIWKDYEQQKKFYTTSNLPSEPDAAVKHFCGCIDQHTLSKKDCAKLIADGLVIFDALHPDNRKKRVPKLPPPTEMHYPNIIPLLNETLLPLILRARSPDVILARLARDCKRHLKNYCDQEEKINFKDLLLQMHAAIANPSFKILVQNKYAAAIIDEFQDTDPLQWNIFKELFLSKCLYLVGDPKQAIYSFRQADIYTYLSAAEAMGKERIASLDTNYRSSPPLIDALNTLFCEETAAALIPLPKLGKSLSYYPVKAGKSNSLNFGDGLAAVNFCAVHLEVKRANHYPLEQMENDSFFPHIAEEIKKILSSTSIPLGNMAVLVSDRYQAERLSHFLHAQHIPYLLQRSTPLSVSPALNALKEILTATIDPKDLSAVKIALGGQIIRYTHNELLKYSEGPSLEKILEIFYLLRKELFENGFSSLYERLFHSTWPEKKSSTIQNILSCVDGLEFYDDLQQIAEILMEYQSKINPSPDSLLAFLNTFEEMALNDEPSVKRRRDPESDAVNIITMHSSKGLEYDVVYALGLVERKSAPSKIVPVSTAKGPVLRAVIDKTDPDYLAFCHEIDAEKMRLLYVAMTRAKYRLYLPVAYVYKSKVEYACASPMDLYLSKLAGSTACDYEQMYEKIASPDPSLLQALVAKNSHIALIELKKKQVLAKEPQGVVLPILKAPQTVAIPGCDLFMQSFSSLTRAHTATGTAIRDNPAPNDFLKELKTVFTLPSGSETGNLLHLILETLDFQGDNIKEHIANHTRGTVYEAWSEAIEEIVNNVLNAPIDGFFLRDIPNETTYREMEFIYPVGSEAPYLEEFEYLPGYFKGIIDLVLKTNGRYYIIDWKSNWLGGCLEDYQLPQLEACVIDHRYYLQAALYRDALKKYLALVDPQPFEQIYGGAYYLFLRGLSSTSNTGIIPL